MVTCPPRIQRWLQTIRPHPSFYGCLIIGAVHALTFSQYAYLSTLLPYIQLLSFGLFIWLLSHASSTRQAFSLGWGFGLGHFGVGLSWIYVSLHDVSGIWVPLAGLATLCLAALMALYTSLASGLSHRWGLLIRSRLGWPSLLMNTLAFASLWTLLEWTREWFLTGFPWLSHGYAHVDSPLSAWAPLGGTLAVSYLAYLCAFLIAYTLDGLKRKHYRLSLLTGFSTLLIFSLSHTLRPLSWVQPEGRPLHVRLLQGNIPQTIKWNPDHVWLSIDTYLALAKQPSDVPLDLIVLPETALPLVQQQLPPTEWQPWVDLAQEKDTTIFTSISHMVLDPINKKRSYFNAVYQIDPSSKATELNSRGAEQAYQKEHLVPFGEYTPPLFSWLNEALDIPMSVYSRGPTGQAPFRVQDQVLAMTICYEDTFGTELATRLRDMEPSATILANVSNLGWFGDSLVLSQHLNMSRMRSLETQRPMIRATNTGITAAINHLGQVTSSLTKMTTGHLDVTVQGMQGQTPFIRYGNLPLLILVFSCLILTIGRQYQMHRFNKMT